MSRILLQETAIQIVPCLQVWQLVDHELVVIPIDQFGHFDSSSLFVVQYAYLKQSALYTWMEGTVYVWVGEGVGGGGERDVLVREALDKVETIGPTKLVSCNNRCTQHIHKQLTVC